MRLYPWKRKFLLSNSDSRLLLIEETWNFEKLACWLDFFPAFLTYDKSTHHVSPRINTRVILLSTASSPGNQPDQNGWKQKMSKQKTPLDPFLSLLSNLHRPPRPTTDLHCLLDTCLDLQLSSYGCPPQYVSWSSFHYFQFSLTFFRTKGEHFNVHNLRYKT